MSTPEATALPGIAIWIPAIAALGGALVGSIAPLLVGLLNGRAEGRRERLRLAVQLAIEDHKHLMEDARIRAKSGARVGVQPVAPIVTYHLDVLERLHKVGSLTPADFSTLRERQGAIFDALVSLDERGEKGGR